jgi:uncharacterized membrane protein
MLKDLLLFGIIILALDIPFITYIVAPNYKKLDMALNPNVIFALCAYIAMILGWYLIQGDLIKAALLGFVVYATYAFTLAAILPGYTLSMALTEVVWGTLLFTLATFITNKILNRSYT